MITKITINNLLGDNVNPQSRVEQILLGLLLKGQDEYYGKSTDTKPKEDVKNASIFYEMDTGNVFMFDEDTMEWLPQ